MCLELKKNSTDFTQALQSNYSSNHGLKLYVYKSVNQPGFVFVVKVDCMLFLSKSWLALLIILSFCNCLEPKINWALKKFQNRTFKNYFRGTLYDFLRPLCTVGLKWNRRCFLNRHFSSFLLSCFLSTLVSTEIRRIKTVSIFRKHQILAIFGCVKKSHGVKNDQRINRTMVALLSKSSLSIWS